MSTKLSNFIHGAIYEERPDVMAVVTDATNPAMDGLIDAAFAGAANEVEVNFAKRMASN